MSWEPQAYSFGNPNAQPPTPTQTPTSAAFPSPVFYTPRANTQQFENHSGWTPTFAEEYSVFNATPGRLTSSQGPYPQASTPRPSTASSQKRPHSSSEDLTAEQASHTTHFPTQLTFSPPPVDPSQQSNLSPTAAQPGNNKLITPQKPRKRLEEAFSGQTATPPKSGTKVTRKLAPKADKPNMQENQEMYYPSGTPLQQHFLNFPSHGDMFAYPMSAPATAPAFSTSKPFWDPDRNVQDMNMDFSTHDANMFGISSSHRPTNSFDWSRSNQAFQETMNTPTFNYQDTSQNSRRQRPLQAKPPVSNESLNMSVSNLNFPMTTMPEDPFAMVASTGAVDPGLLFTFPELASPNTTGVDRGALTATNEQSDGSQMVHEPYQHQLRESRRDQEELRRSRTGTENSGVLRYDRAPFNPPAKNPRLGLRRTVSESRPKNRQAQKVTQPFDSSPKSSSGENRAAVTKGRSSPLKRVARANLASIPEFSGSGARTAVTFSIDANGRARTQTTVIVGDAKTVRGGPTVNEDWDSEHSGSSSDDDIMIPSRTNSFVRPDSRTGSNIGSFDTSRQSFEGPPHATGNPAYINDQESEAETVMDDDGSGDAANALRKVMENRKQGNKRMGATQTHRPSRDSNRSGRSTPQNRQQYRRQPSSTNISPTTMTDPDLSTPYTDDGSAMSDSTRCICNSREGGGFMIQCESCEKWLHAGCVGVSRDRLPKVYICAFCAQTPNMRGGRIREPVRQQQGSSPLAHKASQSWR